MVSSRVRKAVTAGVLSAVVLALGFTNLDFIPLPLGSVTILHVPVIIGAVLEGPLVGLFIGLLFGVFSIIKAAMIGATPVDLAFLHFPFIAIIPRLCIGPLASLVYALALGPRKPLVYTKTRIFRECAALALAAIAGSLVNTALVLSALAYFVTELGPTLADRGRLALAVALTNGPLEAACAAGITVSVVTAWKHIPSRGGKSRLAREEEQV